MLNEERIYLMTQLAVFEQEHKDQLEGVLTGFRSDYIGKHMIKNGFRITFAFLLALLGWGLYNSETLIVDITRIDINALAARIIFAYAAVLAVFLVLTYAIWRVRYERARDDLDQYREMLHELEQSYRRDDIRRTDIGRNGMRQVDIRRDDMRQIDIGRDDMRRRVRR